MFGTIISYLFGKYQLRSTHFFEHYGNEAESMEESLCA